MMRIEICIVEDRIEIADFWDVRREPQALSDEVK